MSLPTIILISVIAAAGITFFIRDRCNSIIHEANKEKRAPKKARASKKRK